MNKTKYREPHLGIFISQFGRNNGFGWLGIWDYRIPFIFCESGHFGNISCTV